MRPGDELKRGDRVVKRGGDYSFEGEVVTVFQKRIDHGGEIRCIVEDDRGLLFIFKPSQLEVVLRPAPPASSSAPSRY